METTASIINIFRFVPKILINIQIKLCIIIHRPQTSNQNLSNTPTENYEKEYFHNHRIIIKPNEWKEMLGTRA